MPLLVHRQTISLAHVQLIITQIAQNIEEDEMAGLSNNYEVGRKMECSNYDFQEFPVTSVRCGQGHHELPCVKHHSHECNPGSLSQSGIDWLIGTRR